MTSFDTWICLRKEASFLIWNQMKPWLQEVIAPSLLIDRVCLSLTTDLGTAPATAMDLQTTDPCGVDSVPQAVRVHYTFPDTVASSEPSVPQEISDLGQCLGLGGDAEMPRTRKQHQVIEHTAKFIFKHGHK